MLSVEFYIVRNMPLNLYVSSIKKSTVKYYKRNSLLPEGENMKIAKVKAKAKEIGVKPGKLNKIDLIQKIQKMEGNSSCFCTKIAPPICGLIDCLWRTDCKA